MKTRGEASCQLVLLQRIRRKRLNESLRIFSSS